MLRLIFTLIFLLSVSTSASASTLRLEQHADTVHSFDCFAQSPTFRIVVFNSSNEEQGFYTSVPGFRSSGLYDQGRFWVPPLDSIWVDLYAPFSINYEPKLDTIRIWNETAADSLTLHTQYFRDSLLISGEYYTGSVSNRDSLYLPFSVQNLGPIPYPLSRLVYRGIIFPVEFLEDTIAPGEIKTVQALVHTYPVGYNTMYIYENYCVSHYVGSEYRVYDPRAYFVSDRLTTSYGGCDAPVIEDFELILKNDGSESNTIASIEILSGLGGWALLDASWQDARVASGDSIRIRVRRLISNSFARLVLKTTLGVTVEAHLRDNSNWTKPRFYIDIDTLWLKGGSGDKRFHQFSLASDGNLNSIIKAIQLSDSTHWEVTGLSVGDTLPLNFPLQGELHFKGAAASGDYPVTMNIHTTPCDTILTRTVIMSLTTSSVNAETKKKLNVYPLPAASFLHVEAPLSANISLLDILGRTVRTATANEATTTIDVSSLTPGSYVLVVEQNERVESKVIVIDR